MSRRHPIRPAEAFTALVLEIFRINGRLLATGDRIAAPAGLTSARWQVLGAIDQGPRTVAEIARAMGLARQSVQRTVDALAADGVVGFAENPRHRRAKLVEVTEAGRVILAQIGRIQGAWARDVSAGIPAGDLAAALALLRTLRERLEAAEPATSESGDAP